MDNREDPGQYYPGGSVVPARPEPAAHPVESVNGHAGNVVLNASDVGALPDTTAIPTADTVSGWGFLRKTWANLTAAFASIVHTHTKSNITDFAHGHSQSDVTGLTTALAGKQAELVSGTNIKTVNGQSLLGSGNVVIQSGTSAHASTHAAGGADEVTPASIGALASNGTAANSLQLGGIDASEYAQVDDVPTVVAPSSSAAEDAAAGAKATGEALETLSSSVPTAVSDLSDAGDYLKKSGGTMTGSLTVEGVAEKAVVSDGEFSIVTADDANVLKINGGYFVRYSGSSENTISLPSATGTLALTSDIKTKTSELTNDSGFVTASDIPAPSAIANSSSKIDADGKVYSIQTSGNQWSFSYRGNYVETFSLDSHTGDTWIWKAENGDTVTYSSTSGKLSFSTTNNSSGTCDETNADINPLTIQSWNYSYYYGWWQFTFIPYSAGSFVETDKLARDYPIKSLTVTSGAATAVDSTINTITPTATTTIAPPTAKTIGARDWLVVVTQGSTVSQVKFSGSYVADSSFSLPTMEANKTYVFSFTEISSNKFIVSVKEVADVSLQS